MPAGITSIYTNRNISLLTDPLYVMSLLCIHKKTTTKQTPAIPPAVTSADHTYTYRWNTWRSANETTSGVVIRPLPLPGHSTVLDYSSPRDQLQKSTLKSPAHTHTHSRRRRKEEGARRIPLTRLELVVGRRKITRRHFFHSKKGGESSLLKLPLGGACVQTLRCSSKVYSAVALSLYGAILVCGVALASHHLSCSLPVFCVHLYRARHPCI